MDALINVNGENVQALQILFLTTLLTLLPSAVVDDDLLYQVHYLLLLSALGDGAATEPAQYGPCGHRPVSHAVYHVSDHQ